MSFSASHNITPYQTVSVTPRSSQNTAAPAANQIQGWEILLLLLVISCFCLGRWCQKQWQQQADARGEQQAMNQHRQHIESLERIWKMSTYQKPGSDKRG